MLTPPWYYALFPPAAGVYEAYQLSQIVPSGQVADILQNAITGAPTNAQIAEIQAQGAQDITGAANGNAALAAQQIALLQQNLHSYTASVGGTAEQQILSAVTSPLGIPWWLWLAIGLPAAYLVLEAK